MIKKNPREIVPSRPKGVDLFRIVLAGCGAASEGWLKAIAQAPQAKVVGLVDLVPEVARRRAKEFALEAVTGGSLTKVIEDSGASIVFDCTVPGAHREIVLTALACGCHVLGEKPLSTSMGDARVMIKAAADAGLTYAVVQNYRYVEGIRRLRAFLETGALGKVHTINADYYVGPHFGGFRDLMEHPLLLDMAIHTFDAGRFLCGVDPVAVYCHEWNPPGSWYRHGASASAIFEMAGNVVFNYRGSWCAEGLRTASNGSWRIIGEEGTVLWDGSDGLSCELVAARGSFLSEVKRRRVPLGKHQRKGRGHLSIIEEFLDCVGRGAVPETVASDNIKSLAMVLAAVQSVKKNRRVEIAI